MYSWSEARGKRRRDLSHPFEATLYIFKLPLLPARLSAFLADQQVLLPTGVRRDELWCDTLPSALLCSRHDQDESPCCPTGDTRWSCCSHFWGPVDDAEDLDTTCYCAQQGQAMKEGWYVRWWDNIPKWGKIRQTVIIHCCHIPVSVFRVQENDFETAQ